MRRLVPSLPAALLALPLLLAACSGSSEGPELPAESAFAEGTCRQAAPDVIAVGRALPRLGEGGAVDKAVKDDLRESQDRLFALSEGAEPQYAPALSALVERIGGVRIRADGNTYEPVLGEGLQKAYDEVVEVCTAGSPDPG